MIPPKTPAARPHVITRRSVVSWVLYDLANTVFSMNILSLYFSLFVRDEVGRERADWVYGLTWSISMGVIFVLSPVLGAMTDHARRRVPFLIVSTLICILFTALLGQGGLMPSLIFFVVANIAFQAGLQFYDALLPDVSTEQTRGWIGGIGIGVGYLGSFLGVGAGLLLLNVLGAGKPAVFQTTATIFLLFAWPAFFFIRERGNPSAGPVTLATVRAAIQQVRQTLRKSQRYPGLLRFLIGRVFYADAMNTVVPIMGLYVTNLAVESGLGDAAGQRAAQFIMLVAISFAVVGGFLWGKIADLLGPKRTLNIVLFVWMGSFLAVALIGLFRLPLGVFYVVASVMGLAMGGTWAADRPYMLRLTPPDRIGEFYGLYGMVGRFAAITGPLFWSLIVGGIFKGRYPGQPVGVLFLMTLVILSYLILRPVSDHRRAWTDPDSPGQQSTNGRSHD